MSIFDQIISAIAPYNCVECNVEGRLLCADCVHKLQIIPSRCYRCRRLTELWRTCVVCRKQSKLYSLRAGVIYAGPAKSLVWRLKFTGAQAAAAEIVQVLIERLVIEGQFVIVPVPTATSRVRQRGYDQAKLLARNLSREYNLPRLNCLVRSGQAHQVGAKRQQRLNQLKSAFRVRAKLSVKDLSIILVDDVVTTGASLEAAATCLKAAGAKRVEAIVFAQA